MIHNRSITTLVGYLHSRTTKNVMGYTRKITQCSILRKNKILSFSNKKIIIENNVRQNYFYRSFYEKYP